MAQVNLLQQEPDQLSSFGRPMPHRVGRFTLVEPLCHSDLDEGDVASTTDGGVVVLKTAVGDTPADRAARERELGSLAACSHLLAHPNIARVVGYGRHELEDGDRCGYVAFEHAPGIDLRQLLHNCARRKIEIPVEVGLTIICSVLRALDHAHRARDEVGELLDIVHGDVTASKVLVGFDGRTRLSDFAFTRDAEAEATSSDGAADAGAEPGDRAGDLHGASLLLRQVLFGRANNAQRARPAVLLVRGLPRERRLHAVVHRALATTPSARYQTAAAMLRDLEAYADVADLNAGETAVAAWLDSHFGAEKRWQAERVARVSGGEQRTSESLPEIDSVDVPPASGIRRIVRRPEPVPEPSTMPRTTLLAVLLVASLMASFAGTAAALYLQGWLALM